MLDPINSVFQNQGTNAFQLFNIINPSPSQQTQDVRPWWATGTELTLFDQIFSIALNQKQQQEGEDEIFDPGYIQIYLQHPNRYLEALAEKITKGSYSNDDKATDIIQWVLNNFPYATDEDNYGYDELWIPPIFALKQGSGDCEDGAFLVHSLLLHAGIPYDRIRTYGGFVDAGEGAASGGHAWTAYRRESDDEWVVLDSSYYPNFKHVEDRPLMRKTAMYRENYFFFNKLTWTNLTNIDRIHNPGAWYSYNANAILEHKLNFAGSFINRYS
jgi:transglutaminase-like putative cysteine protease